MSVITIFTPFACLFSRYGDSHHAAIANTNGKKKPPATESLPISSFAHCAKLTTFSTTLWVTTHQHDDRGLRGERREQLKHSCFHTASYRRSALASMTEIGSLLNESRKRGNNVATRRALCVCENEWNETPSVSREGNDV